MSVSLQLFLRPLPNKKMGIVGLLTTDTPLSLIPEMCHAASLRVSNGQLNVRFHEDITPAPMGDKCYDPLDDRFDTTQHNINGLLIFGGWERMTSSVPNTAAGRLFIREAQTFPNETQSRYIVAGAWDDNAEILKSALCGGASLFAQGEASAINGMILSTETHSSDLCQGNNLGQVLMQPIWRHGDDTFALISDLYLPVMKEVFAYTQYVAATGSPEHYIATDPESWATYKNTVKSICCHFDSEDYVAYLQAMHHAGWRFTDNIDLRTPKQNKYFNFLSRDALNRVREHA